MTEKLSVRRRLGEGRELADRVYQSRSPGYATINIQKLITGGHFGHIRRIERLVYGMHIKVLGLQDCAIN